MKIKEGKSALEQNLYRSFLLLSATLVLISLCFTLFFDISRQRKDMDKLDQQVPLLILLQFRMSPPCWKTAILIPP